MTWFYRSGNQEIGPVAKADLQALIKSGAITAGTLVRSATTQDWKPLSEWVRPSSAKTPPAEAKDPRTTAAASAAPIAPPEQSASVAVAPAPPLPTAVCSQCGRSFPNDQVILYDNHSICAACKPLFVQKLKEGLNTVGLFTYAGFWIRLGAKFIDGIILFVVQMGFLFAMSLLAFPGLADAPEDGLSSGMMIAMGIQQLLGLLVPATYNTFFVGRFGATPGKMVCRLKVVLPDGARVTYLRAFGRYFAEMLSALILLIGYIMAGFDEEKRALHDRICSTRVIYK